MSKENRRLVLALVSLFVPLIGIFLYFFHTPRKDARLFGFLGVVSILIWGFSGLNF